jgi:hypothetical protein
MSANFLSIFLFRTFSEKSDGVHSILFGWEDCCKFLLQSVNFSVNARCQVPDGFFGFSSSTWALFGFKTRWKLANYRFGTGKAELFSLLDWRNVILSFENSV